MPVCRGYRLRMPREVRCNIVLYAPQTLAACNALSGFLEAEGIRTSISLPDPARAADLPYGILPYATLSLALRNGKQPLRALVDEAAHRAYDKLRSRFGEAAL